MREAARERRTATLKQNATVQEFVPERDADPEDGAGQPQARFPSPDVEREPKQPDAYSAVREEARERRAATLKQNATVVEFVPQRDEERDPKQPVPLSTMPKPAPKTRDMRAKAAGTSTGLHALHCVALSKGLPGGKLRRAAIDAKCLHSAYMIPTKQKGQSFELA